jgi:hypothetical protein|tara:strand:+ start:1416 stop:3356 length:1941 start_codon:yes stop_codon:yes gene_type:complete
VDKSSQQKFWASQIASAKLREDKWRKQGDKIVDIYRKGIGANYFNILWANTEILKAATLSNISPPSVTRRYKDEDPVAKQASDILERALEFVADDEDWVRNLRKCRDDMLLCGRGTMWYEYDADFDLVPMEEMKMPPQVDEAGELIESEAIYHIGGQITKPDMMKDDGAYLEVQGQQRITPKYVYWKDLLHSDSRSEEDVWWKARRHGLNVDEITSLLGEEATKKIDLPEVTNDTKTEVYEIWEIWCKTTRKRIWFTDRAHDTLEIEPAPCQLTTFFPCPKSLYPFETTNTMVPVPEYTVYQPQAQELNVIVKRLTRLTTMLKVAGVYNGASADAVIDMNILGDGEYKAIQNAGSFQQAGGFQGALHSLPLQEIITTIQGLEARKGIIKGEIYEITGISDVIRGDTKVHETATAQRLKGSYGSLRLRPRREPMEEFIRDGYRIMSELISDKFTASNLERMTGLEANEEVMELLQNDQMRSFRIDVETDSTVQPNEEIDQRRAMEYGNVVGNLLSQALPAAQAFPALGPYLGESVKFISRQFKAGRALETSLNAVIEQLQQAAQQPPQEEGDGKAQIEQQKLQMEQMKVSQDGQIAQMENQTKMQIAQTNAQVKVMDTQTRAQSEADRNATTIRANELDVLANRQAS